MHLPMSHETQYPRSESLFSPRCTTRLKEVTLTFCTGKILHSLFSLLPIIPNTSIVYATLVYTRTASSIKIKMLGILARPRS